MERRCRSDRGLHRESLSQASCLPTLGAPFAGMEVMAMPAKLNSLFVTE
jgi:hypothetical protein